MATKYLKITVVLSLLASHSIIAQSQWQYLETDNSRGYQSLDIKGEVLGRIECTYDGKMQALVDEKPVKQFIIDGYYAEPIAFMLTETFGYIKMDGYYFEGRYQQSSFDEFERCYPIQPEH